MINKKELICISCPLGCRLIATVDSDTNTVILEGNKCPRGEIYGKEELLTPKRIVTATVKIKSNSINRIPVKTNKPIKKELINDLLEFLYKIEVEPPKKIGDKLVMDYKNSGVDVIFTRNVDC